MYADSLSLQKQRNFIEDMQVLIENAVEGIANLKARFYNKQNGRRFSSREIVLALTLYSIGHCLVLNRIDLTCIAFDSLVTPFGCTELSCN